MRSKAKRGSFIYRHLHSKQTYACLHTKSAQPDTLEVQGLQKAMIFRSNQERP
jgi:hypothetical protein